MEYEEFMDKYGDVEVKFASYYKYSFFYKNDDGWFVAVGGDASDIYRFEVDRDSTYKLRDLEPNWARLNNEDIYTDF